MEYLKEFFDFIDTIFRPLVVLVSTCFAIFFYVKKVGDSVYAKYEVVSDRLSATRISNIVLINKKDKRVCIYAVYAVFDKEIFLNLHKCNPPLILKAYETISIETEPYTSLYIGHDEYNPVYADSEIYLDSSSGLIKCKSEVKQELRETYRGVMKNTMSFNGIVHGNNYKYILVYRVNGEIKTTFIHKSGAIVNDWEYAYNYIKPSNGEEIDYNMIVGFLNKNGFSKVFENYNIYEITFHSYDLVYSTTNPKNAVQ